MIPPGLPPPPESNPQRKTPPPKKGTIHRMDTSMDNASKKMSFLPRIMSWFKSSENLKPIPKQSLDPSPTFDPSPTLKPTTEKTHKVANSRWELFKAKIKNRSLLKMKQGLESMQMSMMDGLKSIIGKDCPIPSNIKESLLEACKIPGFFKKFQMTLKQAKKAKAQSEKTLKSGDQIHMSDELTTFIKTNLSDFLQNEHAELAASMICFSMFLGAKTGQIIYTQFVTDSMKLVYNKSDTSGTVVRYKELLETYKSEETLEKLTAAEKSLAEKDFTQGANGWWEKSTWSETSSDPLSLTWTGSVAIPKDTEQVQIIDKSASITFSSLKAPLTLKQKASAMRILEDILCFAGPSSKKAFKAVKGFKTRKGEGIKPSKNLSDIPKEYREALSSDPSLWDKVDNNEEIDDKLRTQILKNFESLIDESNAFKIEFERLVAAEVMELGK